MSLQKCATAKGEASREEILHAAMTEFALHGLAGARTAEIAKRAGVNIALIFYYFGSKAELYQASVEAVLVAWREQATKVLAGNTSARKRVMDYAAAQFDFIAAEPLRANLIQGELSRRDTKAVKLILRLVEQHIRPVFEALCQTIEEGVASGEFRAVHPLHTALSINGLVRFYFTGAPIVGVLLDADPFAPARLKQRRDEILEFVGAALAPVKREPQKSKGKWA